MKRPLTLAFDTAGPYVAAVLSEGDILRQERSLDMARGQAEHLLPILEEMLASEGVAWGDVQALGVGVGPGNFTGIRIAVSAARGLAMGLDVPCHGLSAFALARDPTGPGAIANELVVLNGSRGQVYAQSFRYGEPVGAPRMINPETPPEDLRAVNLVVTGAHARALADQLGGTAEEPTTASLTRRLAKLLDWRVSRGDKPVAPVPLYVRPPDAAPPREAAPVIVA